jgi:D-arabinose 1-dehydrogenase-like Zn-dependent alcohol dehydrogenase
MYFAAGTVVKTISAYDMAVSNALYGSSSRYISRQRTRSVFELLYAEKAAPLMDAGNTTFNARRHSGELPSDFVAIRGAGGFGDLGVHL